MLLKSSGCFRPLGLRSIVRELVLDLSPQRNCWQQLYWNSWSLSSTDQQGTFAFSFTLMALKWLFGFPWCWRGVRDISSVWGCCPSQVSSAASALCPHIFAFGGSVHGALLNIFIESWWDFQQGPTCPLALSAFGDESWGFFSLLEDGLCISSNWINLMTIASNIYASIQPLSPSSLKQH